MGDTRSRTCTAAATDADRHARRRLQGATWRLFRFAEAGGAVAGGRGSRGVNAAADVARPDHTQLLPGQRRRPWPKSAWSSVHRGRVLRARSSSRRRQRRRCPGEQRGRPSAPSTSAPILIKRRRAPQTPRHDRPRVGPTSTPPPTPRPRTGGCSRTRSGSASVDGEDELAAHVALLEVARARRPHARAGTSPATCGRRPPSGDQWRDVLAEVVAARAHEDVLDLVVAVARLRGRSGPSIRAPPGRSDANACSRASPLKRSNAASAPRSVEQVAHARGEIVAGGSRAARLRARAGSRGCPWSADAIDTRAARDGELDRDMADAAAAAADEQRFAAAQAERLERLVGGERYERQRRASSNERPDGICAKKPSGAVVYSA